MYNGEYCVCMCMRAHVYACVRVCAIVYACIHAHVHVCAYPCGHVCMQAYVHYILTCVSAYYVVMIHFFAQSLYHKACCNVVVLNV